MRQPGLSKEIFGRLNLNPFPYCENLRTHKRKSAIVVVALDREENTQIFTLSLAVFSTTYAHELSQWHPKSQAAIR